MKIVQIIALFLLIPIWVVVGMPTYRALGELIPSLYNIDKDLWSNEGKPHVAFLWEPPEGKSLGGNVAYTVFALKLIFTTPTWLHRIPEGRALQKRLRISFFLQLPVCIAIFCTILSLSN